jgi:hypothetical protein
MVDRMSPLVAPCNWSWSEFRAWVLSDEIRSRRGWPARCGRIGRPLIGSYKAKRREHIQADSAGRTPCLVNHRTVPHDHIFSTVIRPQQHGHPAIRNTRGTCTCKFAEYMQRTREAFGDDPFPCGIEPNEKMLQTCIEFCYEQGLTREKEPRVRVRAGYAGAVALPHWEIGDDER